MGVSTGGWENRERLKLVVHALANSTGVLSYPRNAIPGRDRKSRHYMSMQQQTSTPASNTRELEAPPSRTIAQILWPRLIQLWIAAVIAIFFLVRILDSQTAHRILIRLHLK